MLALKKNGLRFRIESNHIRTHQNSMGKFCLCQGSDYANIIKGNTWIWRENGDNLIVYIHRRSFLRF